MKRGKVFFFNYVMKQNPKEEKYSKTKEKKRKYRIGLNSIEYISIMLNCNASLNGRTNKVKDG